MDIQEESEKGVSILSFDAGGPSSISQLLMLKEFMARLAFDLGVEVDDVYPADHIDLIGGVGFGGLSALLLGRLRMHVDEAMDELAAIGNAVFPNGLDEIASPEFNTSRLRNAIEDLLRRRNLPIDMRLNDRNDPNMRCKVVVFSTTTANVCHCHPFRNYNSPRPRHPDCTFLEAVCAILANPPDFSPIAIGRPLMKQQFIGTPLTFHNPIREVLKEAWLTFGDKRVCCLLSLGSGKPAPLSFMEVSKGKSAVQATLGRIVQESEKVATELSHQLRHVSSYLRLNVDSGLGGIQNSDWYNLGPITDHTYIYLEDPIVVDAIDRLATCLSQRTGTVTLRELNGAAAVITVKLQPEQNQSHQALSPMAIKQMRDVVQETVLGITLVDSIGNYIPIPMNFSRTYETFRDMIRIYFKDQSPPGRDLVERGEYELVSGRQRTIVRPDTWMNAVQPGARVEMSMILRESYGMNLHCPGCNKSILTYTKDNWTECPHCSKVFRPRSEDNHILNVAVTSLNDLQLALRELYSGQLSPRTNTREERPTTTQDDGEDEWEKFRLISVINPHLVWATFGIVHAICSLLITGSLERQPD
ncbi:FabD/lysophospholipase-like protein [Serendipita vermifera]|nr:FabD/lysophospholipase-like protein [Serendipita vermifera]